MPVGVSCLVSRFFSLSGLFFYCRSSTHQQEYPATMKGGCQQSNRHEARLIYCQGPGAAGTLPQQQKKKHAKWCRENASLRKLSSNLQRDAHQIFGTRGDLQHVRGQFTGMICACVHIHTLYSEYG